MALDEHARHELYVGLEEALGTERATTLMQLLPPVGWADVATKHDLDGLEQRIELRFEVAEHKLEAIRHELMAAFSGETRTLVFTVLGGMLGSASLVLAAAQLG